MRTIFATAFILVAACAPVTAERAAEIRAVLERSSLSLEDAAGTSYAEGVGVSAVFLDRGLDDGAGAAGFSVAALASADALTGIEVGIDAASGDIIARHEVDGLTPPCPNEVPLAAAIASAEEAVAGEAITIQPDDDGNCNRQLQVLLPDALWSVKLDPDGVVLEEEEDDDAT